MNLYIVNLSDNGVNWLEILFSGLFTFLAVYLAYYLENERQKRDRKKIFVNILKLFQQEILGNKKQLENAIKNYEKVHHIENHVDTSNFPISLEVTKSFLNNEMINEFLSSTAINEVWELLTDMRKRREQQSKGGIDFIKYIKNSIKKIENTDKKLKNKISDLGFD